MKTALNKAPSPNAEQEKSQGNDWLIKETELRLRKVIEKLDSPNLTEKEERAYTDAYTKLAGTLQKLYALNGVEIPEEDLATLLSKVPEKTFKKYRLEVRRVE